MRPDPRGGKVLRGPGGVQGTCQMTFPSLSKSTKDEAARFSVEPVRLTSSSVYPSVARTFPSFSRDRLGPSVYACSVTLSGIDMIPGPKRDRHYPRASTLI